MLLFVLQGGALVKVILSEDIKGIGKKGEIVEVKYTEIFENLIKADCVRVTSDLLRLVDAFCNHKIEFSVNLQLLQNFFTDWQLTPSFA